jgi:PAS domain S-box-containing protein
LASLPIGDLDERVAPPDFWHATIDALPDRIAVLDRGGRIVAVNHAWREFADANSDGQVVGADYLASCDMASAGDPLAADVGFALRGLIAGTQTGYEGVYPCNTPSQQQWFQMRAAPFDAGARRCVVVTHHDITVRHEAERRSRQQAELLDVVDTGVIATDEPGRVTHWNDGAERMIGWTAAEAVGRPITELSVQPAGLAEAAAIREQVRRTGRWDGRFDVRRKDGSSFPAKISNVAVYRPNGAFDGVVGAIVDLSAAVDAERQLRGARDFLATVTRTMPEGLVVLDAEGRMTLVNEGAEKMLGWTQEELLGRLKHEMMHALKPDGTSVMAQDCPITRARAANASVHVDDDVFQRRDGTFLPVAYSSSPFTTDMGASGSVVVFSDITDRKARELQASRAIEELAWVGRIRDALDEDRLVLYAQPIIDVISGETVQHELLVRMVGPAGEVIQPGAFLPVAEQHGLIAEIDKRVLEMALPFAAAGHPIEVNLSADSISDPSLFELVDQRLRAHRIDPQNVVIEITETALIQNEAVAQAFIENVRRLGCGVALDDFGTGYGSFRYLKQLPVTLLKIDQEFVRDLDGAASDVNRHVIKAIVALAKGMGQKTVGEGIETSSMFEILRELGVDYAQGYHFAHPAPAGEIFRAIEQEQSPDV